MPSSGGSASKDSHARHDPDADDQRYLVGDVIVGKYRLGYPLGEGGMGVVWVARNVILDVDVALKLIPIKRGTSQETLTRRLLQEARTAAQIAHPAICRVFDFGETRYDDPFVVSELLRGETLGDLLEKEKRIPATRAVQMLLPIVDGLAVAHTSGVVHRDVKPDNIFLARDVADRLQPKLLDFGIARFTDTDVKITVDGALLGTPNYMSPEQARGEAVADFRTDIWSVCVVLYDAISGRVPFTGENYNAILYKVIHSEPKPITKLGAGDQPLWRLLERGLKKEPDERWQSMRELGEALALWLHDHGIRDDVCGASLRTAWLEAGLSDVQIELPHKSIPPPPSEPGEEVPAEAHPESRSEHPTSVVEPHPFRDSETPGRNVFLELLRPEHRRKNIAIAVGAAAVLGGLALALGSGAKEEDSEKSPSKATSARVGQTVPTPVASVVAPTASAPASAAASASAAPTATAEAPKKKAKPRAVRQRPPKKKKRRDFGF